ncbi:MAG: lysophospholipid acyltransferase family protein [Bacteroidales bacterium]
MIQAQHKEGYVWFFDKFIKTITSGYFQTQHIEGEWLDPHSSVLILSNHIGWWDGFWLLNLNNRVLHLRFYVMMHQKQLVRYPFFKKIGAFSIDNNPIDIKESLSYSISILEERNNLLVIFPQGNLESLYQKPIRFHRGIEYILSRVRHKPVILFVANLIDFGENRKLSVTTYLESVCIYENSVTYLESAYNDFYNRCIEKQIRRGEI